MYTCILYVRDQGEIPANTPTSHTFPPFCLCTLQILGFTLFILFSHTHTVTILLFIFPKYLQLHNASTFIFSWLYIYICNETTLFLFAFMAIFLIFCGEKYSTNHVGRCLILKINRDKVKWKINNFLAKGQVKYTFFMLKNLKVLGVTVKLMN